jgi:hypothetical protein
MDPSSKILQRKSTNGIRLRMWFSETHRLRPFVSTTSSGPGRRIPERERNLLRTKTAATEKVNQMQCTSGVTGGRRSPLTPTV